MRELLALIERHLNAIRRTLSGSTSLTDEQLRAEPIDVSIIGGGDATAANQTTMIGHLDGVEGLLTTIDGDTGSIATDLTTLAAIDYATETTLQSVKTAVEIIDNAISGNEMQVDIISMPTVTATSTPDLASVAYDAGARQRVSQLTTLGDYKILNADRTLLIETAGSGTGLFTNNTYTMSVTGSQYLIRQSKKFHPYFSGKSQIVECTFENFNIQANVTKRVGYFSSNAVAPYASNYDGIFLENDGTDIRFRISNNGTTVLNVTQANWNVNTLNGHDWSKFNVILIDFLWLGGATVRLFVKTATGFQLCHVYSHAASSTGVMILSPNRPIRYEIRGNSAAGTMTYICSQVSTEGSVDEAGIVQGLTHSSTGIVLSSIGTTYPILGVRKKTTSRDVAVSIMDFKTLTSSNNDQLKLWLLLNPTLSAPLSYSSASLNVETAVGNGTITVSSVGTPLVIGFSTQNTTISTQQLTTNFLSWMGNTLNNTMDEIVLCGTPITSTITTHSALTIKEY